MIERLAKNYCKDFQPVIELLNQVGATYSERKNQMDYFFSLPLDTTDCVYKRLKLRTENGEVKRLYYYDTRNTYTNPIPMSAFDIQDPNLLTMLSLALGVKTTVEKVREVWRKENVIFNIDSVQGVGCIFEVERIPGGQIELDKALEIKQLFQSYLGESIDGSNEDLVAKAA